MKTKTISKTIIKYRKHSNILAIKNKNDRQIRNFCRVSVEVVVIETNKLNLKKAAQASEIPAKILKQKADIFGRLYLHVLSRMCRSR